MDGSLPRRTLGGLPALDVLLAAALCVFAVGGLVTGAVPEHPLAATVPIAMISTLLIAVRVRFPVAVAAVIVALSIIQALLTGSTSNTLWSLMVFLAMAYTMAAERDEGWALVGFVLVVGGELFGEWLDQGTDYAFIVLVFGGVWLFGRSTRSWHNQAISAKQHQRDLAQLAVASERARIARELHDVVAHSLSVIAVQADAAEAALMKAPERAGKPMRAIRDSARDALADMRQIVHLLRDADDIGDRSPAHDIDDLRRLVTELTAMGFPVRADIRVSDSLPAGIQLTTFRIVQEGLTNVRKHAGEVDTRLVVATQGAGLRIEVSNDAPAAPVHSLDISSTSSGLLGIRERAQAAGGLVRAGSTPSGGYTLSVILPLNGGKP